MEAKTIELVQNSFKQVVPIADTAAEIFYDTLFRMDPSLRVLFRGDMAEQRRKLMTMLGVALNGLSRLDQILSAVQDLGRRHAGYGVTEQMYQTVGAALIETLGIGLGDAFTPEVKSAWIEVYTVLANTMQEAAYTSNAA